MMSNLVLKRDCRGKDEQKKKNCEKKKLCAEFCGIMTFLLVISSLKCVPESLKLHESKPTHITPKFAVTE